MKNKDKFAKEILGIACSGKRAGLYRGKPVACGSIYCILCGFNPCGLDDTHEKFKEWCEREYVDESCHNSGYWERISDIAGRQREKGMNEYGRPLEEEITMDRIQRLTAIEEELVDALMYIEHVKEGMLE